MGFRNYYTDDGDEPDDENDDEHGTMWDSSSGSPTYKRTRRMILDSLRENEDGLSVGSSPFEHTPTFQIKNGAGDTLMEWEAGDEHVTVGLTEDELLELSGEDVIVLDSPSNASFPAVRLVVREGDETLGDAIGRVEGDEDAREDDADGDEGSDTFAGGMITPEDWTGV